MNLSSVPAAICQQHDLKDWNLTVSQPRQDVVKIVSTAPIGGKAKRERPRLRAPFRPLADLAKVVKDEIAYQAELWNGNYEGALASAETVLAGLNDSALRGYRALWHYLAGSAAWLGSQSGIPKLAQKARSHFSSAYEAARFIPWLLDLARHQPDVASGKDDKRTVLGQIEKTEMQLTRLGTVHEPFKRRYHLVPRQGLPL